MKLRGFLFISVTAVICLLLFFPLKDLLFSKAGGMFYEYYSHIYLIPLVSAYLLYVRRDEIWAEVAYALPVGLPVVALGIIGYGAALAQGASLDFIDGIAWRIASLLVAWLGWLKRGRYTLFTEFSCDVRI